VGGQRNYHSAIFTAINHANLSRKPSLRSHLVPSLHYSSAEKRTSADETLIRVLTTDIEFLQQADDHDRVSCLLFYFLVYALLAC
jgi:complement component 1 Q subcomponent-binding protein